MRIPGVQSQVISLSTIAELSVKCSRASITKALAPESPLVRKLTSSKTVDFAPELTQWLHRDLRETLAPYLDATSLQRVLEWSFPPIPMSLTPETLVEFQRTTRLVTIGAAVLNVSAVATVWPVNPTLIFDLLAEAALPHEFRGLTEAAKAMHSDLSRRHLAGALRNVELRAQRLAATAILEAFLTCEREQIA